MKKLTQKQINLALAIAVGIALIFGAYAAVQINTVSKSQGVTLGAQALPNYFRQVIVAGASDVVPLAVTGYTTQTNPLIELKDITGTSVFSVTNAGGVSLAAASVPWASVDKTGSSLADLTTKSAASLSSGTLADARLSSNVPLLNGDNTFTGTNGFDGASVFTSAVTINNLLTVNGNADADSLSVAGNADLTTINNTGGDVTVQDNLNVTGTLGISGDTFTGTVHFGALVAYTSGESIAHGFSVTPTVCLINPIRDVTSTLTITTTGFSSDMATVAEPIYWLCGK